MRVYLASTADELKDFLSDLSLDVDEVYAPTPIYSATHPDMDEEEVEYSLSLLAAEDALELIDDKSGAPLVLAFEVSTHALGDFDEVSAVVQVPLVWEMLEAIFLVGEDADDLTWFAPQEAQNLIDEWMAL
jgi:8-oxo-dGTP pyrophosphatase MutT (NUDIX family)